MSEREMFPASHSLPSKISWRAGPKDMRAGELALSPPAATLGRESPVLHRGRTVEMTLNVEAVVESAPRA